MLSPNFPPLRNPESLANGKLAIAFLRAGWDVDAVTIRNDEGLFREDHSGLWDQLGIHTHGIGGHGSGGFGRLVARLSRRLFSLRISFETMWARDALRKASELIHERRYDAVLSRSLTILAHWPALRVAARYQLPWIANWNDPAPAHRNPQPYGRGLGARAPWYWESYVRAVLRKADWHTFPSERLMSYMKRAHPGVQTRMSVIPHVALDIKERAEKRRLAQFVLCHAGEIGWVRDPRSFLDALAALGASNAVDVSVAVEFIGEGVEAKIGSACRAAGHNVRFLGGQAYDETLRRLSAADVILVIEADMEEGIYLPSKFVDAVQCRRPIMAVSPRRGTVADLLGKFGGGVAADCRSATEVEKALLRLVRSWQMGSLEATFSSEALMNQFCEDRVLALYKEVFEQIGVGSD
jgi:glycosyltransferase involved in cell wall biosynthesis